MGRLPLQPNAYDMMKKRIIFASSARPVRRRLQRGASLIMVLLVLIVVSLLGVGGAQIALMSERSARNDRDQQIAWQASEAGLNDAEADMFDPTSTRVSTFDGVDRASFLPGCGTSGNSLGLCELVSSGKPAWLTADFLDTSGTAPTTALGTFSGRTFAAGGAGVQPAMAPRYVIEWVNDPVGSEKNPGIIYRVTSMGFGPRVDIQAVTQILYRK